MVGRSIAFLSVLAACGGADVSPDAYDGPCWPLPSQPGGEVQLGTGDINFVAMPDVLVITKDSSQFNAYLSIHSRILGMPPGNPDAILDPANPKTKVAAEILDAELVLGPDCPANLWYVQTESPETFDLFRGLRLGFPPEFPVETADGKQARITIEVVGSNGRYARAEKTVTLMAPDPPTGKPKVIELER